MITTSNIPKVIHFCWFSKDPFPEKIQKCIESWKKNLPDYEIKCWNYDIFPRGKSKWVDDAFDAKKYAFAADYIRCYALYHEGGIYLDSDVEVIKPFDNLLHLPYFIGQENEGEWEAAVMGSVKNNILFYNMLQYYNTHSFHTPNGYDVTPLPHLLIEVGSKRLDVVKINSVKDFIINSDKLQILPYDYFSPKSYKTGELNITDRTYSIHHFTASWHGKKEYLYKLISKILGKTIARKCSIIWKSFNQNIMT